MKNNIILNTDSYKVSHWMQYPEHTSDVFSYIEARGAKQGMLPYVVPFGIQMFVEKNLLTPITQADIDEAEMIYSAHLGPYVFNKAAWEYILKEHGGLLPVEIKATPEGLPIPVKNAIVTIHNTDPECYWLTSYLETSMLRDVWYPTTVATISHQAKQIIAEGLKKTNGSTDGIDFMLHDFGCRGVSSQESAEMGGLAHLINFKGTDTVSALRAAREYYGSVEMPAFSVIAAEHSTACANSNSETKDDFAYAEKMVSILEQQVKRVNGFAIVAAVADTYDVYRFADEYLGTRLKSRIENSGGKFVARPDSGNPVTVPVEIVEILMKRFGYTTNSLGYKMLPPCIGVLQGDGINLEAIREILALAESKGLAASNFVFGMGGGLLQHCDRDWFKFAMKASAVCVNNQWRDVFKDPITDPGKLSKKGVLTTIRDTGGNIQTVRKDLVRANDENLMQTVYRNGALHKRVTFDQVRKNALII